MDRSLIQVGPARSWQATSWQTMAIASAENQGEMRLVLPAATDHGLPGPSWQWRGAHVSSRVGCARLATGPFELIRIRAGVADADGMRTQQRMPKRRPTRARRAPAT